MNTIFRKEVAQGWLSVYMDDIAIHTKRRPDETEQQHQARHHQYTHQVLDKLEENDLYLKPEKCTFEQEEIDYLEVIVGRNTIKMDPSKIKGVADWPIPTNPTEIHQFLGFTGYYWYFIPNYSKIAQPLLDLTKKAVNWNLDKPQAQAFKELKSHMCVRLVLAQPDFNKQFYLQTDASAYGVGTVLSQEGEATTSQAKTYKLKLHPIAYYLATFIPAKRNYDIYERELLAMMKSLTHWRHYLGWTKKPFKILTDHANLQYWKSPKNLNCRTARWHTNLQEYDYEIQHVPGKTNIPADTLSRPLDVDQGQDDNQNVIVIPQEKFTKIATTATPEVTEETKCSLITLVHDHYTMGHPGRDETICKAKQHASWNGMNSWIADYVKGCATCQQNKILTHRKKIPLYRISMKEHTLPFQ